MKLLGVLAGNLLYLEIVYHLGCFGLTAGNPVFTLPLILVAASLQALVIGSMRKRWRRRTFVIFLGAELLLFGAQTVYFKIFRQPLMWEAAYRGGGDAITNYWREALEGILKSAPVLALLALPLIASYILLYRRRWRIPVIRSIARLRLMLAAGVGVILALMVISIGKYIDADYYADYHEFYDPLTVAENMGMLAMIQRDTALSISRGASGLWGMLTGAAEEDTGSEDTLRASDAGVAGPSLEGEPPVADITEAMQDTSPPESAELPKEPDTSPNQLPIDFAKLKAEADSEEAVWLAEYMEGLTPTRRNEYTGIFEGYNLIYLTAEGFSPYAVREDLTPTLYRLVNSGFVFDNFYAPLWQTSTSDGEYINCTGLIPDGQFSMRKSSVNDMAFTLPRFFAQEGVGSLAYHNNTLSYYERHLTHNNLGYDFKAAKLGDLEEAEWGDKIFPMENPDSWPASDLEMIQGTLPEYIGMDRFHVYYMTVSGHMNYNFKGNAMSGKNKEAVEHLEMSENARAYIACHIELDKALQYLLEQLEAAGKLENTVICMSTDHYPYGMTEAEYEELAGKPLSENLDLFRNNLILWNAGMEEEPVKVEKVCGSMDIIPTLLNLFGFDFDSRLYAGRDIFSDEEGLVILNDRSFITDTAIYSRKAKTTWWKTDMAEEAKEQYMSEMKQEVKERYQFSAYILQKNYYKNIKESLPEP